MMASPLAVTTAVSPSPELAQRAETLAAELQAPHAPRRNVTIAQLFRETQAQRLLIVERNRLLLRAADGRRILFPSQSGAGTRIEHPARRARRLCGRFKSGRRRPIARLHARFCLRIDPGRSAGRPGRNRRRPGKRSRIGSGHAGGRDAVYIANKKHRGSHAARHSRHGQLPGLSSHMRGRFL